MLFLLAWISDAGGSVGPQFPLQCGPCGSEIKLVIFLEGFKVI